MWLNFLTVASKILPCLAAQEMFPGAAEHGGERAPDGGPPDVLWRRLILLTVTNQ